MSSVDAVLSELRAFLASELAQNCCRLPPHVEERRQVLLEHLDLLTFGPCPSPPPPPPPLPHLSPPSSHHFSTSSSVSLGQRQRRLKRHSMPPAVVSTVNNSSPITHVPIHYRDSSASGPTVDHVSSSSNTSDYATPCGGPSQRVSFETAAVVTTTTLEMPVNNSVQLNATSPLYEEPVNFIQRLSTIPASQEEPISGWSPEHRQLSHPQMGTQIRHSLSSQLESSTSSTSLSYHPQQSTLSVNEGLPIPPVYPTVIETPVPDTADLGTLMLPKKSLTSSRRGTAPLYTLAGALYHRYKPSKWTRLGYCVLTPDAHLLGFRSSANQSASPAVSLFVAAASTVAVYAGRESGMQHVFKVTHSSGLVGPSSGDSELPAVSAHGGGGRALVFAADCEEEALSWINQINQYAQGITPSRVESFTDHFCRHQSTSTHRQHRRRPSDSGADVLSLNDFSRTASTVSVVPSPRRKSVVVLAGSRMESKSSRPHSLFLPHVHTSPNSGENQQKAPPLHPNGLDPSQEDSGFSGLISSSSSATDGTNGEPVPEQRTPLTIGPNSNILRHQRYSVASTASPSISTYDLLQSRASGLLSSVRRKVADSLNLPKRRSLVLPPRTAEMLNLNQSPASPKTSRREGGNGGLVGWTQLDAVLGNDPGSYLSGDGSVASPRTRSWRSVRGKHEVKLIAASPRKSSDPPLVDDSVLSGDIFISIPGRLSWTRRYCALRCSNLEIYASILASTSSSSSNIDPNVPSYQPPLVLSLPLQPGVVEVSPASDKRHPSAVRLSAPALSPHPLLLDAGDTIVMGRWIRGIIEALGHIRSDRIPPTSNRHSAIFTPPSPEPIYDEVAFVATSTNLCKRWTWTSPPVYRSVVMEVTPLPTLPSAGPSSPTGSSHNGGGTTVCGGGGIYSSVYYDSVVPVEEEGSEVEEEEDIDNDTSEIRRHSSSLHSRTSHDMLSRSFSSLQVASTSDDSTGYSNSLLRNREDLSGGLRLRRYKSLDWHFSARLPQETELPATPCCLSEDKVTSFLEKNSGTTPTAEISVARSYSCAVQTTTNQEKTEQGDFPTPRGITIPLGCSGTSSHDLPPMDELEHKTVETFGESGFSDGIEEALSALEAVTNATYRLSSPPSSQPSSRSPNLAQRNQQTTSRQRGSSKKRRNNRRRN